MNLEDLDSKGNQFIVFVVSRDRKRWIITAYIHGFLAKKECFEVDKVLKIFLELYVG